MSENVKIQALDKALDIIEFLYHYGKEASIGNISEGTGLCGSTVFRQLSTLKARGYIYQNTENSKYSLGLRFYALGSYVREHLPLINIIAPKAEKIAEKYGQTIYVTIPSFDSSMCAQQMIVYRKSFGLFIARNAATVGMITPSHAAATGKCMMAHYPDEIIRQYEQFPLLRLTEKTITDWTMLKAELKSIKEKGYALDSEEEEEGQTCIAVPVIDSQQKIMASISLSGQTKSIFKYPVNDIVKDLNGIVEEIRRFI
ncbi:MAG: IclR family transcriptional regulator [Treponema sp.]|jgi:DNA-binding IclR family transcriptional regulator|nr:IclR family transcriptional regulator [Treponema sp.]